MSNGRVVDVVAWDASDIDRRIEIVERTDGRFTLRLLRFRAREVTEYGDVPGGWEPVPIEVVLCDSIDRARDLAVDLRQRYE